MKKYSAILMIVFFIILSAMGIFIGVNTYKESKKSEELIKKEYEQRIKETEEAKKKKEAELKKQQEELKKAEAERRALDEKCNEAQRLFNNKKYKEAIKVVNDVIAKDDKTYRAYVIKGIALCYDRKSNGFDEIEKALSIKPDYGYAMYNMALAYELSWEYDSAQLWYEKTLKADSDDSVKALSNYGIAVIYARKGEKAKATEFLKEAVRLNSELTKSAARDPVLKGIRIN